MNGFNFIGLKKRHATDLNKRHWGIIKVLPPDALPDGRPRTTSLMQVTAVEQN